jgi:hypothetical protein
MRRIILALCILAICTVGASAQSGSWVSAPRPKAVNAYLSINYFANANTAGAPDGGVRSTNAGTAGGNLCAYYLVHDPNQELSECCGCLLTPDGLRTLSLSTDLTSNPLNGVTLSTGTVEIVSALPVNNTCPLPGTTSAQQPLAPGITSWSWGAENQGGNSASNAFVTIETPAQPATLSAAEDSRLYGDCASIVLNGSGSGICTCGTGD